MADNPLWSPSNHNTIFSKYVNFLERSNLHKYSDYKTLHKWSIANKNLFWKSIWDFTDIKGERKEPTIQNEKNFLDSKFFKNSKLNFTKNVIKNNNNNDAIVFLF